MRLPHLPAGKAELPTLIPSKSFAMTISFEFLESNSG
jgi:hypothetical protein